MGAILSKVKLQYASHALERMRLLLMLCASVVCFHVTAGEIEPSYQGRSFTEWANQIDFTEPFFGQAPPPVSAIRHIGTNGIPILLKWISNKKPAKGKQDYKSPVWYGPSRVEAAAMLFNYLGAEAKPAIPPLTHCALTFRDFERYENCVKALSGIGTESLPAFEVLLTKGNPGVQLSALGYLPAFGSNAVLVMPAVVNCLLGMNDEVGDKAVSYFENGDIPHSVSISVLTNAMTHASMKGRVRICRCLFFMSNGRPYWEQPFEALPALRVALKGKNVEVSNSASNVLASIESSRNTVSGR